MALNQNDLKKISNIVNTAINPVKTDVKTLKKDVKTLKKDVSSLQTDVTGLKTDVSSIKETAEFTKKAVIDILDWTQDIHESIFLKKIPERVGKLEESVFGKTQN